MPFPIPIIIAAIVGAIAAGALIYFFVSNRAAARREQYMGEVQKVLELLMQKVNKLKEILVTIEQERDDTKKEVAQLKRELAKTQEERKDLQAELDRWRAYDGTMPMAASIIKASAVLALNRYRPRRTLEYLKGRQRALKRELGQ